MDLQIGAIYLWSYVYNIVRVYSRSNKEFISTSKFSNKSSTSDLASCMEPLLDSGEISVAEDNADRFAPPYTVHGGRNEVGSALSIYHIVFHLEQLSHELYICMMTGSSF